VEKELSGEIGRLPEKHDLSFYPTIHDLQNHIHRALQDIKDGTVPFTSTAVSTHLCSVNCIQLNFASLENQLVTLHHS